MKHSHRYDLPKGHIEIGESEIECALRELEEETTIPKEQIYLEPNFRFETIYYPKYKRFGNQKVKKSLIIFLGKVDRKLEVISNEHSHHEWIAWNPPHIFQNKTIDSLLVSVEPTFI